MENLKNFLIRVNKKMIVYRNRYVKKHVIGGSGILDTLKNILRRAATSSASRAASTLASRIAKTELGREAIMATKSAGKELASTAISTAKDVLIKVERLLRNCTPRLEHQNHLKL